MIVSFADKETENLYSYGESRKFPSQIIARAIRKLDMLDNAYIIADLRVPPSNRLHSLEGDRKGQFSISINDQWRICFRFDEHDAFDVEICDYH